MKRMHVVLALSGLFVIGCLGQWHNSTSQLFLAPAAEAPPLLEATVPQGAKVELATNESDRKMSGLRFAIPAGTMPRTETIAISKAADPVATETISLVFSPEGLAFDTTNATPTLTVTYTEAFLADNGIEDPTTIKVASRSAAGIVELLTVVARDTTAKTITVAVPHFSVLELFGTATQPTGFGQVWPEIPGPLKLYPYLPDSVKTERTLLLVHGICSSGEDIANCKDGLLAVVKNSAVLRNQYKRVLVYNYPWKRGFNATDKEKKIENRPAMFKVRALAAVSGEIPMLDIVAHSMGGCVSRYGLELLDVDGKARKAVRNLVMIATPSGGVAGGSALAAICSILAASRNFQATVDLSPLSVRIEELATSKFDNFKVRYVTIAGNLVSSGQDIFPLGVATTSVELGEQGSSESRPPLYEHLTFHGKPGALLPESSAGHSGLPCRAADPTTIGEFASITSNVSRTINASTSSVATVLETLLRDPAIESVKPASGPLAGATPITIKGVSFFNVSSITLGGKACTDVTINAAGDTITATTPQSDRAAAVDLIITSSTHGTATRKEAFTYVPVTNGAFQDAVTLTVGATPIAIVIADFNGDGKPDFATANDNDPGDVSVLLAKGAGQFESAQSIAMSNRPKGLGSGDFNGDGKPDLAVLTGQGARFLLNSSTPEIFTQGELLGCVLGPANNTRGFQTADLNRDGRPDLAVGISIPPYLPLCLSKDTDQYEGSQVPDYYTVDLPGPVGFAELNRDGILDLLVGGYHTNFLYVQKGNGDGTFKPTVGFPVRTRIRALALADVNADGALDVLTTQAVPTALALLLGNGAGGFTPATEAPITAGASFMAAADLNGDGTPDVVTTSPGGTTISVLLLEKAGAVLSDRQYAVGQWPGHLAIADLNGDGKLDIAVANRDSNSVSVLLQE